MGTNYYLELNKCKYCGKSQEIKHIGESSLGWCFALHVYPEDDINDLDDWINLLESKDDVYSIIKNEYDEIIDFGVMLSIIKVRQGNKWEDSKTGLLYKTKEQFHKMNNSMDGPNNLMRRKIDGTYCIGHGQGTWDLVTGDFC